MVERSSCGESRCGYDIGKATAYPKSNVHPFSLGTAIVEAKRLALQC